MPRYLEDLQPGDVFFSPALTVGADEIDTFARTYDPQPFHLDPEAAAQSFFGTLVASGWHTAALTMRLIVTSEMDVAGGYLGAAVDEMRWPHPVVPGDELRVRIEVLEVRPSRSKPDRGLVRSKIETQRGDGATVQHFIVTMVVPARPR